MANPVVVAKDCGCRRRVGESVSWDLCHRHTMMHHIATERQEACDCPRCEGLVPPTPTDPEWGERYATVRDITAVRAELARLGTRIDDLTAKIDRRDTIIEGGKRCCD